MKTAKELRAEAASERKCRERAARDGAQHAKKFWAPLNQLCDAWEKNVASVRRKWWDDGACDDRRSIDRLFSKLSLGLAAFVKVAAATGFSKRIEQATEKDLPNKRHDANALRALQAAFEGSTSARAVLEQIAPDDVERQTLFFKQGPPDFLTANLKEILAAGVPSPRSETTSAAASDLPQVPRKGHWSHSDDFRSAVWAGQTLRFTPAQARVVEYLAKLRPGMSVGEATIIEKCECDSGIRDLFRRNKEAIESGLLVSPVRGQWMLGISGAA